jgi:hypothetical protein
MPGGGLAPTPLGDGDCQASNFSDGDLYAQVAISGGVSCPTAAEVASGSDRARGAGYSAQGFKCQATKEAATGSPWSLYWAITYYAYTCKSGSQQVAFNWGTLTPGNPGEGDCTYGSFPDRSTFAQLVIAGGATCATAEEVAKRVDKAKGAPYSSNGFSCSAMELASGSRWSSAWGGDYYAYVCHSGSQGVAFNWGTDYTY